MRSRVLAALMRRSTSGPAVGAVHALTYAYRLIGQGGYRG